MAQDEQDEPVPFQAIAERFGRQEPAEDEVRTRLGATRIVLDGYGSIGRPMSEELAQWGVCRFVIADPKSYVPQSVWSQCTSQEVGRLKVDVGGERLRALGAEVASYARDINSVPEGVVTPGSIVVTTVDNRRADIVSNRRAARMGARLIKVNVEPTLGVVAVRAYDFRRETRLCVECQFGDHHYAAQRHPQSCDGSSDGRRTNSPRWLSQTAARLGAMVAADLAAEHPAARDWIAHEWQYTPRSGHVRGSQLEPNGHCRWDHAVRWENVVRTTEGPKSLSLQSLFRAAKLDVDVQAKIRFCQQIALRGRCRGCRCDFAVVRWFCDLRSPVGVCPSCGGVLLAIPFAVFREASLESLLPVLDPPLEAWGVEPLAVMELSRHDRRTTFVVGGGQCG